MLDAFESLLALKELRTMGQVAARLRITQSGVSKRIKSLEAHYGVPLIEKDGRHVRLTEAGERLASKAQPALAELRTALVLECPLKQNTLVLGVSESLLSSSGAHVLRKIMDQKSAPHLDLHAHRSPVAIEHVRSGEYQLALCTDVSLAELGAEHVFEEPMVIIPSELKPLAVKRGSPIEVITIEPASATWPEITRQLASPSRGGPTIQVARSSQSFMSVGQMAKAGFGHGLVPKGVAMALGIQSRKLLAVPLVRTVRLIGRPSFMAKPTTQWFLGELRREFKLYYAA